MKAKIKNELPVNTSIHTSHFVALWLFMAFIFVIAAYTLYTVTQLHEEIKTLPARAPTTQQLPIFASIAPNITSFTPYQQTIPIVAVSTNEVGSINYATVKLIPGNNNVLVATNPFLEPDTQRSANTAVAVAKLHAKKGDNTDYIFDFQTGSATLIGGESAGAALTIATIAALENLTLRSDVLITGTIEPDGTIGEIGGVVEKAKTAAEAHYKYFLIPKGQTKVTYYERVLTRQPSPMGGTSVDEKYIPHTVDIHDVAKEEIQGIQIIEVENIDQALQYFVKK